MGKRLSVREIALLVALGLVIVFCAYYYLFLVPTNEKIQKYKDDTLAVEDQVFAIQSKVAHKTKMQKEIDEVIASGVKGNGLSQYDNRESVLRELSHALSRTEEYNVSFADTYEVDGIVRRNITLSYKCVNYEATKNILSYLHDTDYTCLFRDMYVTINDDGSCNMTVYLTYFEYL